MLNGLTALRHNPLIIFIILVLIILVSRRITIFLANKITKKGLKLSNLKKSREYYEKELIEYYATKDIIAFFDNYCLFNRLILLYNVQAVAPLIVITDKIIFFINIAIRDKGSDFKGDFTQELEHKLMLSDYNPKRYNIPELIFLDEITHINNYIEDFCRLNEPNDIQKSFKLALQALGRSI